MLRTALAGVSFLAVQACVITHEVHVEHDDVTLDAAPARVEVDLGAGDLNVFLADGDQVEVRRTLRYSGSRRPEILAMVDGDTLFLQVDCPDLQLECRVDHDVFLPSGASITGGTGAGNVTVDGVPGALDLTTGSGDILILAATGDLALETGSGNILVEDVLGDVDLHTGSGDVEVRDADSAEALASTGSGAVVMDLLSAPSRATIDTGSGDVTLYLPSGAYQIDTSTSSGSVFVEGLDDQRGADRVIDVETGSGDITLTGR